MRGLKGALLVCGVWVLAGPAAAQQAAPAQPLPRASGYAELAQWPDWGGVWSPGVGTGSRTTPTPPKYTPAAQAIVDAFNAGKTRGENLQNDAANCTPNGMPGIMRLPYPIEFTYSPGRVNINIETYSQTRRIYIGKQLPEDPDPFYNGHSVGHWEGDTLIVDSNGFTPAIYVVAGVHATENTRFHERIWREGDILTDEITTIDPGLFTEPYVQVQKYRLQPDWEMREYVCQENNRDAADAQGRPSMKLNDDPFDNLDGPTPVAKPAATSRRTTTTRRRR